MSTGDFILDELLKQHTEQKEAIQRVRELHRTETVTNEACGDPDCCGEYEEFQVCIVCEEEHPCDTIKALDSEIGSVEPVKLEALDGEQS